MPFSTLSLSSELIHALPKDFKKPTDIQALAIPELLAGQDLLALANTGSGKTLAYGLPLLEKLRVNPEQKALILVPTRELAMQVSEAINQVGQALDLNTVCLCGGVDKEQQQQALATNPHILVATTGRLVDLANNGLDLSKVHYLVLDEADRLLDMGFWPDVQNIAMQTSNQRQTAMFSATFSDELKGKVKLLMQAPKQVAAHQENSTNQDIVETLYLVNKGSKTKALIELIKQNSWTQVLVFIGAKENADGLAKKLNKAGISTNALHGDKSQAEREEALAQFKSGQIQVLIATDLLARGIHIEQLPVVINFELPMHAETYVHRVGRTARAGEQGVAMSLVCHGEMDALNAIRHLTQRALPVQDLVGFPVTDKPSTGESKRAPRDKKANRRTNAKKSIKQFQGKSKRPAPSAK
ncbi:DEAD/DEAH box helicase [Vibrio parahaemolyticus]|uniref:ATP-dependent RNA helicase, DEAD box family n=6 Tax=Vibrio parahaemolyticus TaxID=670 RepID=Q87FI0_VIBPA|nr:DEAD/DEAH box helicase [Vibrio parahaemolyticus]EFO39103.1 putative ATP-dependent RNA helicase RhlE [Vibrio parahaemolyticus Peru-466]EFO47532.1 putative ATP-dependent RNA helicase RhlE [Vibrio parahaemolyticus AQ4037]EFO49473.1 putative ATP-dependent RNA helicase RhlE [Vibrio parahaemolyticus K5030]ARC20678.1 ATP-dependent helicase [Vibrio parahaemolyticus]AZV73967.1 DEAD/DEAH box helicase [Vibrio parahaemolyticus]